MRDDVVEALLADLMSWEVEELKIRAPRLQALALLKYDEYGQYRPGAKFAENLCIWLRQFNEIDERAVALDFVEEDLLFLTERELGHVIELAYPDLVRKKLLAEAAQRAGIRPWRTAELIAHPEFKVLQRRSLFLGLSDGARLDRFRRASPSLSHEQFAQEYEVADHVVARLTSELRNALTAMGADEPATFESVWLIDDFTGSGQTLIRPDPDSIGEFKGKLPKFRQRLEQLGGLGLLESDASVDVLIYVATEQAVQHVTRLLDEAGLGSWRFHPVYRLPEDCRVGETEPMADLCRQYYDPSTADAHKDDTPLGYSDCALPLVLSHNTPNNSVCLLWAETGPEAPARNRRALFPRYERHHRDRL